MAVVIANEFHRAGHIVGICATRTGGAMERSIEQGISIQVLNRRWRFDLNGLINFWKIVKTGRYEILHAHGWSTSLFVTFAKVMFRLNTPLLIHDHFGGWRLNRSLRRYARLMLKHVASCYVGVSPEMAQWALDAGMKRGRVACILNGLEVCDEEGKRSQFKTRPTRQDCRGVTGICIGGVRPEKGILELIQAVSKMRRKEGIRLDIVGGARDIDYQIRCMNENRERGLEGRIRFLGEVPNASDLIAGYDFMVVPSLSESGPLVLIEAMLAGVPFICTKVGGVAQAAAESGLEGFVEPGNVNELARELDRLVESPADERERRGAAGRAFAIREFDIRRRIPEWIAVYEKALSQSV